MDPLADPLLIVDDDPDVRRSTARILSDAGYQTIEVADIAQARRVLDANEGVPAVLCDIRMPGGSGLDLVRQIDADFPDVAVVMMTGVDEPSIAREAFGLGAYAYVVKPFAGNELLINLEGALRRRDLERARRDHVRDLEQAMVRARSLELLVDDLEGTLPRNGRVQDTIERLSRAVSLRDEETGRHLERMSRYSAVLAEASGFSALSADDTQLATALHDVGKIGVADSILLKPASLNVDEYAVMQQHAKIGYQLLSGSQSAILETAAGIALAHHEWWDGNGYPRGLRGEEIPEEARIAAVTDVFDALTSNRVYRPAIAFDEAVDIMTDLRGRQFEPRLLDAFLGAMDEVLHIRMELDDRDEPDDAIRVMIVDDHDIFVASLTRLLSTRRNVKVVGTAGSVAEAVKSVTAYLPDIVLMDFELPDGDGAETTERIKALAPATDVIMLTARGDESALLRAVASGCAGFVRKDDAAEDLFDAIEAVHGGDVTSTVRDVLPLLSRLRPTRRRLGADLRPREREVLELAAAGLTNKEIAQRLSLSLNTVRNHMQNLLYRLHCHSKLEAVAVAVREGVISRT